MAPFGAPAKIEGESGIRISARVNTVLPDCNTAHFAHSHAAPTSISGGANSAEVSPFGRSESSEKVAVRFSTKFNLTVRSKRIEGSGLGVPTSGWPAQWAEYEDGRTDDKLAGQYLSTTVCLSDGRIYGR